MRGTIDDLAPVRSIASQLPALYQDDEVARRFTSGLDVVLAPVVTTLDCIESYVDPRIAPLDFVEWLAGWVGVETEGTWPDDRRRSMVASAADLFAWRGTTRGIARLIAVYTGVEPEIEESGGVSWSNEPPPSGDVPGSAIPSLVVRVRLPAGVAVEPALLDRLVSAAKPAHIPHRVEVVDG